MTKAELIDAFAEAIGQPKTHATEYLDRLGDIAAAELLGGGEISLARLGKLVTVERAARQGRNPRTGAPVEIAARKAVQFRPGKDLRDCLK